MQRSLPRTAANTAWIVGIDCAVQARNVGVAVAGWDGDRARLEHLEVGSGGPGMVTWAADRVAPWLRRQEPVLLALDAPLGWPTALRRALRGHRPGEPLQTDDGFDRLFRRRTDELVTERLGKRPLEIGADRIARTAAAALDLIRTIRSPERPLPLAWRPGQLARSSIIEVYPAATLESHPDIKAGAYKKKHAIQPRRQMLTALAAELDLGDARDRAAELCAASDHAVDALLCVLAAQDYLRGEVIPPPPEEVGVIASEGWIWVKGAG